MRNYNRGDGMTNEERELSITYLEGIKEKYIEGEGFERHPLPEYYAIENAIKALEQEPETGHWIECKYKTCENCGYKDENYISGACFTCCKYHHRNLEWKPKESEDKE